MRIHEITCKQACNPITKKALPYEWDLNIYRGCTHGCIYCYAVYSHQYLEHNDFYQDIYVKTNIARQLDAQLSSKSWKPGVINIGGVTDSYQAIEGKYKIMPEILKVLIKHKQPCIISTKSNLILRDFDLIAQLAELTYVNIAASITVINDKLRRIIEPGGVKTRLRMEVIAKFSHTNASTGFHLMPIIPYITDSRKNLETIYAYAEKCGADYILPGTMYLRGPSRKIFFERIKEKLPDKYEQLVELYSNRELQASYKKALYSMIDTFSEQYQVTLDYNKIKRQKLQNIELIR